MLIERLFNPIIHFAVRQDYEHLIPKPARALDLSLCLRSRASSQAVQHIDQLPQSAVTALVEAKGNARQLQQYSAFNHLRHWPGGMDPVAAAAFPDACSEPIGWQLGGAVSLAKISRHHERDASPRTASWSVGLPPLRLQTAAHQKSRQRSVLSSRFSNWPSRHCKRTHRL